MHAPDQQIELSTNETIPRKLTQTNPAVNQSTNQATNQPIHISTASDRVVEMDRKLRGGEEDPSVITEMNVWAVLLYAQGKMDKVGVGQSRI